MALSGVAVFLGAEKRRRLYDDVFGVYYEKEVKREEIKMFAERLFRLTDKIDSLGYRPEVSIEDVRQWVDELVPMYSYQGATDVSRFPDEVGYQVQRDGFRHNHVLGTSDCEEFVSLNARFGNPHSTWYKSRFLGTLAHELAHIQQGRVCRERPVSEVENAAQVVSFEVLAALANQGNMEAAFALVWELKATAVLAVLYFALRDHGLDEFSSWYGRLSRDPITDAIMDNYIRGWLNRGKWEWLDVLRTYRLKPYEMITSAHRYSDDRVYGMAIAKRYYEYDQRRYANISVEDRGFVIDDLVYFLGHAEVMVNDYVERYIQGGT